ncbi:TIGR04222 domain-containing membrane protein [Streptomyces sp. NPDC004111]|uniref:TIGR04222 domain-containing membrane protein n=1 Tax=Streptomyces sp. NPDC004111 TaxID=3364690 RepID=UPI0036AB71FB
MFWVPLLLIAWVAAIATCARLCVAATAAAAFDTEAPDVPPRTDGLTLPEAAFLCGGPGRVADLTLVSMHARRRVLLAHTGWTTVVAPDGRDALERAAIEAAGPGGQSRTAAVRSALAAADGVRALADRLVDRGLAVPAPERDAVAGAVRAVRNASALVLALGTFAALALPHEPGGQLRVALWFALPLLLTVGTLGVARMEIHPYTRWASGAGRQLLRTLPQGQDSGEGPDPGSGTAVHTGSEQALLTAVAVSGVRAIPDPELRTALTPPRRA